MWKRTSNLFPWFKLSRLLNERKQMYCDIKTNVELLFSNDNKLVIPSDFQIKKTIKNLPNNEMYDGFSCIRTKCPICIITSTKSTAERKDIYVNKTSGDVVCPSCQHIYSFSAIQPFFDPKSLTNQNNLKLREHFMHAKPKINDYNIHAIDADAVDVTNLLPIEIESVCSDMGMEKITVAAFEAILVYCNTKRKIFYFPMLDVDNTIVGYKKLSKNENNNSFREETIPESHSFGVVLAPAKRTTKDQQKNAILVVNMLDALAIRMQKTQSNVICLPYGFKTLPQESLPVFEHFQKLILWFDYNSIGWDIAKNFAKKLDEKRCYFVRPTENQPTPYSALQKHILMKTILSNAKPILHKAITTFRSLRQDVLSDLQNIDKVQGIKWNRFPTLNKLLKGHRRGELTVLTGPTGCGKTTFMAEYSLDLGLQGVNTLWGSFEIRNSRLATTLLQQLAGKPLDEHIDEFNIWADKFEILPMYFMTFHGQQALRVVMEAIEHAQYVHDIHHVIIDNLQFMMGTSDDPRHIDRYWRQDEIIASFRTFATRKNCHVTLVIHPRKERDEQDLTTSSIFGSAKATQEADNVLIIQDKRLTSLKGKKYLQVAKNRYSGDLGIMTLEFDKQSLSYEQKKKKN